MTRKLFIVLLTIEILAFIGAGVGVYIWLDNRISHLTEGTPE